MVTKLGCLLLPKADSLSLFFIVEKNKLACRPWKGMRLNAKPAASWPCVHFNARNKREYHIDHTCW